MTSRSLFNISLNDSTLSFDVDNGDTILSAALRNGIGLAYECNSGGCGNCSFELKDGVVEELWAEAPGLSDEARKKGRHLACQCAPASDLKISARVSNRFLAQFPPIRFKAPLIAKRMLTSDMAEFTFRVKEGSDFLPGQFAIFRLPGTDGYRAYSMANLTEDGQFWSFVIKRLPAGRATNFLFERLEVGAEIEFDGPYGLSYLQPAIDRDIICIGGGSGLSPLLSITRAAIRAPELKHRKIFFFYGARRSADHCLKHFLDQDPLIAERVKIIEVVSDEDPEWRGEKGLVHEVLKRQMAGDLDRYEYYVCGPKGMTDALQVFLSVENKVPTKQIHFDRFY
ncbi:MULTISPECIES: 2Fe-2S iron-sulfur cluster-binding protein [Paraburkholderia]|uniref:Ferredoxin reductase DbtAa n=1 Tax=Paraburkholderia fungorum TaxID=134537 RepID=R9W2S1_9BURK|nr:ferredoxin reductase DbtAa [Paraburkholderia fungorum]OWJ56340.1 hypothetical protein BWU74_31065 [Burkholderia sp. Bk]